MKLMQCSGNTGISLKKIQSNNTVKYYRKTPTCLENNDVLMLHLLIAKHLTEPEAT